MILGNKCIQYNNHFEKLYNDFQIHFERKRKLIVDQ